MKLIVGLGNPGRDYAGTRHNVGFRSVDALARKWKLSFDRRRANAFIATGRIGPFAEGRIGATAAERVGGEEVVLAKPLTSMNLSGGSVHSLLRWLKLGQSEMLVVYDDLDLPFGRLRLRERGSAGGHRGIQSIIDRLGSDEFARLRVGIGRPEPQGAIEYVLSDFSAEEREQLPDVLDRAVEAIESYLADGLQAAMNRFNR